MNVLELEREALSGDSNAQLSFARRLDAEGDKEGAESWLRRAASAGNAEAMMAMGEHLLSRAPPVDPAVIEEGRKFIIAAAHNDHGAAAHLVSLFTAIDSTLERNWEFALAYLGRAAKAGHVISQAELAFLAGDDEVAMALEKGKSFSAEVWHRLHDSIDFASWVAVPAMKTVCCDPFIATVEGFISPRICDWIIRRAAPKLQPAKTYDLDGGGSFVGGNRTNREMRFLFPELDLAIASTLYRIAKLCGVQINGMEPTSVLHYTAGQEYRPHYDFLDPRVLSFGAEIENIGQRQVTFLVFLSDDFEGGETDFPLIGYRFRGRKGDAIMFHNVGRDGEPNYKTLHAGLPPISGEKWLLSQWIRGKSCHNQGGLDGHGSPF